jgi:predicted nuclease with TOPRIM domain
MAREGHAPSNTVKGTDSMQTSKYDAQTRASMKLEQRSPEYRELQRRSAEERAKLETKLRERNAVIARLKKKLVEVGCTAAAVDDLAA